MRDRDVGCKTKQRDKPGEQDHIPMPVMPEMETHADKELQSYEHYQDINQIGDDLDGSFACNRGDRSSHRNK
jgi:hypothetical protein